MSERPSYWPEPDVITPLGKAWESAVSATAAPTYETPSGVTAKSPSMRLSEFFWSGWHVLEPATTPRKNWHVDAICEHLEAVAYGQIRNLLITIPPGHTKSLLVSVYFPAWMWEWRPSWRSIFSSYESTLAIRDSVKTRQLLDSDWFRATFSPPWHFSTDQNVKSFFQNSETGFRISIPVGGGTGYRADFVGCDDPLKAEDRFSDDKRKKAIRWWDTTMSSRFSNQETGARVIIMQRLHAADLAGHVIESGDYEHLNLPSEYEPDRAAVTYSGQGADRQEFWRDPRTVLGELLFPEMFGTAVLAKAKKDLGSLDYAAQHQQRPSDIEGSLFKRAWWKYYDVMPDRFDRIVLSLDATFKETTTGSYVVFQVWGQIGADLYLLAEVRARLDFPKTVSAFRWITKTEPRIGAKYVEDKANGPAVIATLKRQIPGIIAVSAGIAPEARWSAASVYVEAGNCYLPSKEIAARWARRLRDAAREGEAWCDPGDVSDSWVTDFVDEHAAAPTGRYDDRIDASSQAILKLAVPVVQSSTVPQSVVLRTW